MIILAFQLRESTLDHPKKNVDFQYEPAQLVRVVFLGRLFCERTDGW